MAYGLRVASASVGALVVLAAQAGSIEPGAEAETVVLVRNTGEFPDTFHVVVQGEASAWAVVDPKSLTLEPGAEAPVWVHFRPPRSPETRPGTMTFAVAVAALGDPDFLAVQQGTIEVGTYASVAASFDREMTTGSRWVELNVTVRNTGNRRVTVSVDAEAEAAGTEFEIMPSQAELSAGQAAQVVVRIRPPRRLFPRKTDRRMAVSVVSDGGALATLRTEYPADPSLVDELFRSARLLLVLLVLLFAGGVALLRSGSTDGSASLDAGPNADLPSAPPSTKITEPPEPLAPAEEGATSTEEPPPEANPASPAKRPAPPPSLPRLVFVRLFGTDSRDLVVREAGVRGTELRLRTDGALERRPRLSPDGEYIAFIRERDASWRVCVVPSLGGDAVCVADVGADASVDWSSDGNRLIFSRGGVLISVPYDVATQTAGAETDLGVAVSGGQFGLSPDGARVVVAEGRRLVIRSIEGGSSVTVDVPSPADDPSFSPDGTRVVFTAGFQIYSAPIAGGAIRQLTAPTTVNGEATWTGDGDWVVFRSNRSGLGDLYCVKGGAGGGNEDGLAQITVTAEREVSASF